jgi:hypothetical protein
MLLWLRWFALLAIPVIGIAFQLAPAAADTQKTTMVFVCLHGSVNSQMAAAYFNKAAQERGLPHRAISRGIDPHRSIPVRIVDGLALDGLAPANSPIGLTPNDANGTIKMLAFDPVPAELLGSASVTYWSGVPPGINDYAAARDEIVRRVDELIPTLSAD